MGLLLLQPLHRNPIMGIHWTVAGLMKQSWNSGAFLVPSALRSATSTRPPQHVQQMFHKELQQSQSVLRTQGKVTASSTAATARLVSTVRVLMRHASTPSMLVCAPMMRKSHRSLQIPIIRIRSMVAGQMKRTRHSWA